MRTYALTLCGTVLLVAAGRAADDYRIPPEKRDHWAWKAPVRPTVPAVRNAAWVRNPIDAFVLARLEAAGLSPAPPATRAQLLRRVAFDLTGLPPSLAEIDAFVGDRSPDAYAKVVDRLLASPHYGERWGRHWLDLARFAESNGFEHDEIRPGAWRYRDYVIRAFNTDKPYDRLVREQLAGDELYPNDPDALIATGFNLLGPDMTDAANQAQRRQNTLDDMTDTTGLVFLGLTVGCARCHDHKFEPIPQRDFYRLQAFFAPAVFRPDLPVAPPEQKAAHDRARQEYTARIQPTTDAIVRLEAPYRKKLYEARLARLSEEARQAHRTRAEQRTPQQKELVGQTVRFLNITPQQVLASLSAADRAEHRKLQQRLKTFDHCKPAPLPSAPGLQEGSAVPTTFVLRRGELRHPDGAVGPGYPIILLPGHRETLAEVKPRSASTGRRAALAAWLTQPDHPLTARVMVNRLWQHHFGRGIVPTASDFGMRGQPPTHPKLLDWLAVEFRQRGWSLKAMHRLMLLSNTYRQSTQAPAETMRRDPDNHLLGRMNRLRLEGEAIRDALLAVSGQLNRQAGGPGVFPPLPADLGTVKGWQVSENPADHRRRSIYVFARRNLRFAFLEAFDLPDSNLSCPKRERSTTAMQALTLLNAREVQDAAKALAARLQREAGTDEERVTLAYRLTLGRRPIDAEMGLAREFLASSPLTELCRALFNVNEFVYLD
ncbi:MAG: DUF1553 domain-containing protein [Gemmataceae bacterium]|nr:DUF1553 domain-containing protein [Gemmataceae bacterium]